MVLCVLFTSSVLAVIVGVSYFKLIDLKQFRKHLELNMPAMYGFLLVQFCSSEPAVSVD